MSLASNERNTTLSEINVTPLTDVMLVLLITFLLSASSFEQSTVAVELPRVTSPQEVEKYACVIEISEDGKVRWPLQDVDALSLEENMQRLREVRDEKVLAIGVHRDCPYGRLFPVLEAAAEEGWEEVVVLTSEAG